MPKKKRIFSFALSKSLFGLRQGSLETSNVSHLSTDDQHCLRRNQRRAALFGIDANCSLPDMTPKWANPLAVVESVLNRFFHITAAAGVFRQICYAHLESPVGKGNAFRASCLVSENSELFKKPEPGAQFLWERIYSSDQTNSSTSESKVDPTTNSRYSSFWDKERSLDSGSLLRTLRHSVRFSVSHIGLRRPSALGLNLRLGKTTLTLRPHTALSVKD